MAVQISELLEPIAGANPAGASLRYEPVYDQIKHARLEEDELPTGDLGGERKTADYPQVIRLASEALARRSKDLQVAAWLTEALLKREGFGGLTQGLQLLRSLVEGFWDHLYPELDEDGDAEFRAAPLAWVGQYLDRAVRLVAIDAEGHSILDYRNAQAVGYETEAETYDAQDARKAAIEAGKLTAEERDAGFKATTKAFYKQLTAAAESALAELDALDLACQERFGVAAPRFSPLREAIGEVQREVAPLLARKLELEPDPVVVEAPPPAAGAEAPGRPAAGAGAGGTASGGHAASPPVAAVVASRTDAEARIAAAAAFLRAEAPSNPAAYLLLRGFRWGELRATDGPVDPRLLVAPTSEVRVRLKRLVLDNSWRELLAAGEEVMATPIGRGWLDLQRYCVTACDALGGDFTRVGVAVRGALRSLLRELPELPLAAMDDDASTANAETQGWLRAEGMLEGEAAPEIIAAPPRFRRNAAEQAQELVRAQQPQRAIELLLREAEQERSARDRFLRRSQATGIMVNTGLEAVAVPILQQLAEQVQRHALDEWEDGETVASVLGLLYCCLQKLGTGDASTMQDLYLRVCRLDPMRGMQLQPQ